jgi:hypothetical protein
MAGLERQSAPEARPEDLPPWGDATSWWAANHSVAHHLAIHAYSGRMDHLIGLGGKIQRALTDLGSHLNALCRRTCLHCPDPCCLVAQPWYDFRDLLFLHLGNNAPPPRQPIGRAGERCVYWGPRGCRLSRLVRPWICTWYICVTQRSILQADAGPWPHPITRLIEDIAADRKKLETVFIDLVFRE